jgi:hypothetical protein
MVFDGVNFYESVSFQNATFFSYAHFHDARFFGDVNFNEVEFGTYVGFVSSIFTRCPRFDFARFGTKSDERVTFSANFSKIQLKKGADFPDAKIFWECCFQWGTNKGGCGF